MSPDQIVRMWLDPQTDTERAAAEHLVAVMDGGLEPLAEMLTRAIRTAMRDAGSIARHECLDAVQDLVDEIEGGERAGREQR